MSQKVGMGLIKGSKAEFQNAKKCKMQIEIVEHFQEKKSSLT